jgi:hypothetical protein
MPFDGKNVNEIAKTLLAMKAYIEKHGWCQRHFVNGAGQVCILGALRSVDLKSGESHVVQNILNKKIGSIPDWNDLPERTEEQVLNLLEELAAEQMEG